MPVNHAEKCFIDTNVALYLYGHGSVTKARIESVFPGHLSSAPILDL